MCKRERLSYVCNPRSLKEGTEMSRPVATASVPPLSGRVTGSAPQRKPEYVLHLLPTYSHAVISSSCQCALALLVTLEVDWSL